MKNIKLHTNNNINNIRCYQVTKNIYGKRLMVVNLLIDFNSLATFEHFILSVDLRKVKISFEVLI